MNDTLSQNESKYYYMFAEAFLILLILYFNVMHYQPNRAGLIFFEDECFYRIGLSKYVRQSMQSRLHKLCSFFIKYPSYFNFFFFHLTSILGFIQIILGSFLPFADTPTWHFVPKITSFKICCILNCEIDKKERGF